MATNSTTVGGSPSSLRCEIPTITREKIGEILKDDYDHSKDAEPIDCFYLQAYYSIRQWIDTTKGQKEVEQEIGRVIEKLLHERNAEGSKNVPKDSVVVGTLKETWSKLTGWWPLTYFLDTESKGVKDEFREYTDRYLENILNKEIRKKLREELKERFGDVPIIITRACKYTPE